MPNMASGGRTMSDTGNLVVAIYVGLALLELLLLAIGGEIVQMIWRIRK